MPDFQKHVDITTEPVWESIGVCLPIGRGFRNGWSQESHPNSRNHLTLNETGILTLIEQQSIRKELP